ncbi:MAG: hypothetical protein IJO08_00950 [Clostridia bacterium]|nr:hypothetical protein [Clostridia bacterium]
MLFAILIGLTLLFIYIVYRIVLWAINRVRDGADSALTLFGRSNPEAEQSIRKGWNTFVMICKVVLAIAIIALACNLIPR